MAVKQREYLFSINEFKEPTVLNGSLAKALMLSRLIIMEPGTDPLHPSMGVGISKYRYGLENFEELRKNVESQIETYLPDFQDATVEIIITPNKTCNIEITSDGITYVYDSSSAPIPITLSDIANK